MQGGGFGHGRVLARLEPSTEFNNVAGAIPDEQLKQVYHTRSFVIYFFNKF